MGWSPLPPEVSSAHTAPAAWSYVKMQHLSAHETEPFQLKPQGALKVHPRTEPLTERGPDLEQVRAVGGLNRDPPLPEAVVEPAPEPPPQVKAEEPPPPPVQPKSKKKKKKR